MTKNIYDIAREAKTSISTVSRYLNNKNVRPDTKERIKAVIEKYNYHPSSIAKGLVTKSMKLIAVMVVDIRLPHYANASYFIDKELSNTGYRVIVCNTSGDLNTCAKYIDSVLNMGCEGIIFVGSIFNELNRYQEIVEKLNSIPVVITNGKLDVERCISIYIDDKKGIYDATKYLINKGRTHIKYIQYTNNQSAILKADGYKEAMQEAGLTPSIYYTNDIFNGGYDETRRMILEDYALDAILSGEDLISMSASRALVLEGKVEVVVIPTKTIMQGIVASMNFNPEFDSKINAEEMTNAIDTVKSGSVTFSIKDTEIDGVKVKKDEYMAIKESKNIISSHKNKFDALKDLVKHLVDEDSSILTILVGNDINDRELKRIEDYYNKEYKNIDCDIKRGDQPVYSFIVGVE